MEGAKSVIMLAMNYYTKDAPLPEQGKPYGRIAHYARGQDYHKIHEAMAKEAMEYFHTHFPEEQFRFYVDYGPLAERYYAQKAGLGFVGKNCMLITPEFGSWVFLSGFITTMEFVPDTPMANQCGECTKCIPACPGKAFEGPFILNAPKCVSYQNTIQYKRHVPEEQKKAMRPWVFGCDVCQNVCPFNKHPKETTHSAFRPIPELDTHFDLEEPLRHTKESFWEKYKTTLIRNWW
jgi:epoxyqueuosine reductase